MAFLAGAVTWIATNWLAVLKVMGVIMAGVLGGWFVWQGMQAIQQTFQMFGVMFTTMFMLFMFFMIYQAFSSLIGIFSVEEE